MSFNSRLAFGRRRGIEPVLQEEAAECSLACIAMVAAHQGYNTRLLELRRRFPVSLKGLTLDQLAEAMGQLGLSTRALRLELDELGLLRLPCIVHWDMNHFVVLEKVQGDAVVVVDPAVGRCTLTLAKTSRHFTGVALEASPGLDFKRKAPTPPIDLRRLVGRVVGLKRGLLQLAAIAVVMEALAICLPMLNQWITDEAIVSDDRSLLAALVLGLAGVGATYAALGALRNWIGIYISTTFNLQWMSNVMGHLLRLPIDYFERRHLGDIVNRFGSVQAIERVLTTATVEAMLDGLLAFGTLGMMLLYDAQLAAVTVGAVALYCGLRWWRYRAEMNASLGLIVKQSMEQTYFLETIRGVRSIRLFNREHERRSGWINRLVEVTNANLAVQKLGLQFTSAWQVLSALERAFVFWLGATAVIEGRLTIGMLFAFVGYKEQFAQRVNGLIDRLIDFAMLRLQTERLADIVLTPPEEAALRFAPDIPADLTLAFNDVTFRYGPGEAPVLSSASFAVRPGECVAFVGPSGCGKTTAMKLLLGILQPASGTVTLGGIPITRLGLRNYRELIATVMQDDQLYAGSLIDNISFFDRAADAAWVHECARVAGVHDEIAAMPMGYHTLVGDMGTVLSGGQKQRVLLARALYKRPRILFLDEATSHLDVETELKLSTAIAALSITRVMIAHRPQSIAIADRLIRLGAPHAAPAALASA